MNGVQTRFKCKLDVKRCKRFVFPPSSLLPRSNALKTKAIRYFQTDRTLTRIVSPPLPGADGEFVLYEDEFDNYNYEKGMFSTIRFSWNDTSRTLTISDRKGEFPQMLKHRSFRITLMQPGKQSAETVMVKADKKVNYSGKKLVVKL